MKARITVLQGDGIGPEVTSQAVRVLRAVADRFGHEFDFCDALIGGAAIDATGGPLPEATLQTCRAAHAVLLGAVGGPRWESAGAGKRPEDGLLGLRKALGLFANIRPVKLFPQAIEASPLKPHLLRGVDIVIVRELTGGIYFGAKRRSESDAFDLCSYTRIEIERIVRLAAKIASTRRGRLTSVDKANVLETSRLWRAVAQRVVRDEFPNVAVDHLLVDAAAMHLITRPAAFDVIVTENMFGDILTDEASVLAGSIGMLPSASMGEGTFGLYEPIHGSAPDIAGRGIANPIGAIQSSAMLLRLSLGLLPESEAVEEAVRRALDGGVLPRDLAGTASRSACTDEVGDAILAELRASKPAGSKNGARPRPLAC